MTDAEIAEFMGWSQQATDRMRDDPDSFISRVHRLVAEVRRREHVARAAERDDLMQALEKVNLVASRAIETARGEA